MAGQKIMDAVSGCRIAANYGDGQIAGANITITGITTKDKIICAFCVAGTTGKHFLYDLSNEISITATNTVVCSTTNTIASANQQVFVMWIVGT